MGVTCATAQRYRNLYAGQTVSVTGTGGAQIAFGTLGPGVEGFESPGPGFPTGPKCTFTAFISVPTDEPTYWFQDNPAQAPISFQRSYLERSDWVASVTAG